MGRWTVGIILSLIIIIVGVGAMQFFRGNKEQPVKDQAVVPVPDYHNSRYKEIYLAGGCFWGVQAYFDGISGVEYTQVGYANGQGPTPDYHSIGQTGHAETLSLVYDPAKLSLEELLGYFYGIIDPTSLNRQGNDQGTQYRSGIYFVDPVDEAVIQKVTTAVQTGYPEPIVTEILPLANFVTGEEYHQDYLKKNPNGYCHINLQGIPRSKPKINPADYPMPSPAELASRLTPAQLGITQEGQTEPPFDNAYWDNKAEGLYVDAATGEPLFLSIHKFDSGSGWPSFTRPVEWDVVTYHRDGTHGMERIEVRSRSGDSHLGHLFTDGPKAEGGLRYCINSGALNFIPLEEMDAKGYGAFKVYWQ